MELEFLQAVFAVLVALIVMQLYKLVQAWRANSWHQRMIRRQRQLLDTAYSEARYQEEMREAQLKRSILDEEIIMSKVKKQPQTMYRQGDVLLVRVDHDLEWKRLRTYGVKPKDATPEDRIVLAYGEVTGHAHAIYPEVMEGERKPKLKAKIWDAGAERFLQVMEKTALRHEEHTPIELPEGTYKVVRQREYNPERDRYVED